MDSMIRPTSLKYIRAMIIDRLRTYGTLQEPSQWTKPTNFWQMCFFSSGSVWSNFGTNGQDAPVFLPLKALKLIIVALHQK